MINPSDQIDTYKQEEIIRIRELNLKSDPVERHIIETWPEFKLFPEYKKDIIRKYLYGRRMFSHDSRTDKIKELPIISTTLSESLKKVKYFLSDVEYTTYLLLSYFGKEKSVKFNVLWSNAARVFIELCDADSYDNFIDSLKDKLSRVHGDEETLKLWLCWDTKQTNLKGTGTTYET